MKRMNLLVLASFLFLNFDRVAHAGEPLPAGVKAVWDLDKAHREKTTTRERVCLNGLWRWQPAAADADKIPADRWGYFKVPGFWPGTSNYIQEDTQTLYAHSSWKATAARDTTAAWHQRDITIPADWKGRRIELSLEYLNSLAIVYIDGKKAGEARFPAGEVDVTKHCQPGKKHVLSVLVIAVPLKGVMLSYNDTNSARTVKGTVERRGLCGDVWLTSTPSAARITDVRLETSVRKKQITFSVAFADLTPNFDYLLRLSFNEKRSDDGRETVLVEFSTKDLKDGRLVVTHANEPEKLWDVHTPQHLYSAYVSLGTEDKRFDSYYPVRYGFREFWIDGKDFYLNGTRLQLSAVPLDNGQLGARCASYEGARETMKRLQSFGINFVYTHNYGCTPGSHVSFTEILRAADDVGMLVGFSQPHFGNYDWKAPDADKANGYARHAEFYVRAAQNHPSVVAYSMSHNATGYGEDMNPHMMDGLKDPRAGDTWSSNNAKSALRAEAIVKGFDPSRIVYHHSSGNLGSMHTVNFYANFTPIQEMSDWFEHWSKKGVKPLFPVEYGVPFTWDWTMYRGWYKGERNFGSAKVPWEFCLAEWNAQFVGDRAFNISQQEKNNLRWEAGQFKKGNLWHRWDYPTHVGSRDFEEREEIFARYITANWRAHRTLGLSANSPWEHHVFWRLKPGVNTGRRTFKADWDNLQKPGFSADYTQRQNWQMPTDLDASDWVPTVAANALYRNNKPLLAYLGGPMNQVTSKHHNYLPGDFVEKQLIVINNSRQPVTWSYSWACQLDKGGVGGGASPSILRAGEQERNTIRFELPANLTPGSYKLTTKFETSTGEVQEDAFYFHVLPRPPAVNIDAKIAVFDPKGETTKLLNELKIPFKSIDAGTDLGGFDVLIVGKGALTPDGQAPNIDRVRAGLKVIVFEQTAKVLEQRFGFRVAEYGLREVFKRVPDHPLLTGLDTEHLHDWRGDATILEPKLTYTMRPRHGPTVQWCGLDVPRAWRVNNRGNVASVLIEKPARGDFLSIVDGGYGLQYSPLMEYREGKGVIVFFQMDVTGRTESDPAADALVRNVLRYASTWKPRPRRSVLYVGEPAGKAHLEAIGLKPGDYTKAALTADRVLIVGPGGGKALAADKDAIAAWLKKGGNLLALGLDQVDANAFLSFKLDIRKREHIAGFFGPPAGNSLLAGVGPADIHNRDPRETPLIFGGVSTFGKGVLGKAEGVNIVFCQLAPWQFEHKTQPNLRRTHRNVARLVTRLAANLGAAGATPTLERFRSPVDPARPEQRWLQGHYLDVPEEWDDPYRFFRW